MAANLEEIWFWRSGRKVHMLRDKVSKKFRKLLDITVPDEQPLVTQEEIDQSAPVGEQQYRYQADHEGKICDKCSVWDMAIIEESEIPLFFPDAVLITETQEFWVNYHETIGYKNSKCHCLLQPITPEQSKVPGKPKTGLFQSRLSETRLKYATTQSRSKLSI